MPERLLFDTEPAINALKYAFPGGGGKILVRYDVDGTNWRLSASDNGVGLRKKVLHKYGLGDEYRRGPRKTT